MRKIYTDVVLNNEEPEQVSKLKQMLPLGQDINILPVSSLLALKVLKESCFRDDSKSSSSY